MSVSNAITVELGKAVVATLNSAASGTFGTTFTAARKWLPEWELEDLQTLRVTVIASAKAAEAFTRGQIEDRPSVALAVQKAVDLDDAAEIDALALLTQQIDDYLRRQALTLTGYTARAQWLSSTMDPVADPSSLEERRVFFAMLNVTYAMVR